MNDFLFVGLWVAGTLFVMLIFLFAWRKEFKDLTGKIPGFFLVYIVMVALYIVFAIYALIKAEDPNKDWARWAFIISATIACIWNGGWCSQHRIDKSDNIGR